MKFKIFLLSTLFALTNINCAESAEANVADRQSTIKTITNYAKYGAQETAKAYMLGWLTSLGHEMGHAVTYFALTGKPAAIILGASPRDISSEIKLPTSGISVQLGGFYRNRGFCAHEAPNINGLNEVLKITAGPLAGMASVYALLKINNILQAYDKDKSVKQIINDGIRMPISSASTLVFVSAGYEFLNQYFNLTSPLIKTSDSYKIFSTVFGEDFVEKNATDITSIAITIPLLYGAYKGFRFIDKHVQSTTKSFFARLDEKRQLKNIRNNWTAQEDKVLAQGLAL